MGAECNILLLQMPINSMIYMIYWPSVQNISHLQMLTNYMIYGPSVQYFTPPDANK